MLNSDQASTPWYSWAAGAGAGTLINSFINCVVICSHPGFAELSKQAEQESALAGAGADPSKMTTEQLAAYLQAHPEVAKAAMTAAVGAGTATQAPAEAAFTGGAGTGAAGSGGGQVQEWGAVSVAASSKPEKSSGGGGGLFGFGKKKDKGDKGEAGGYVPPAAPAAAAAAPSDVAVSLATAAPVAAHAHDGGSNPFGGFTGSVAASAPAAAAPFGAPAAAPSAAPRAAAAPAAHHEDVEDNPFAS